MLVVDLGSLKVSSDPTQERITNTKVGLKINVIILHCRVYLYHVAQLAEHWTSIPKVAGSIPTVAKQLTFQLARCGCTLRVTSQTIVSIFVCLFYWFSFFPLELVVEP